MDESKVHHQVVRGLRQGLNFQEKRQKKPIRNRELDDMYDSLYPFVRSTWCSDHWRPPEAVKMTSDECWDDVWWCPYPGTSQRNHDHQCSKSLV
jgi:hypothetical protein